MALTENLDVFLADFGVACSSGGITGVGILDMPSQIIADGMVLTTDYKLTCKTSQFGHLLYGSSITVDNDLFEVKEVMKLDDGVFCEVMMSKVTVDSGSSSETVVDGGRPDTEFDSDVYDGGGP